MKTDKNIKANFHQLPLQFLGYPSGKAICVWVNKLYLDKTANLRDKDRCSFFISYVAPYAPATSKAIALWVVEILGKAGINTKTFKAHATRSVSTSAAYNKGLSLSEIGKAVGWSNFTIFAKFYNQLVHVNNFGLRYIFCINQVLHILERLSGTIVYTCPLSFCMNIYWGSRSRSREETFSIPN